MKILIKENKEVFDIGRWDIDYLLPPEEIKKYPDSRLVEVSELAFVADETRNPTLNPTESFKYVDIASIDIQTGTIIDEKELMGEEAPSRARKVIRAYDIVISTVRPTRGAVAVIPERLHNQICSTGFTVLRCKENVNPFYLHFLLRTKSTREQFRKFSTGSSYPAILDSDVLKTKIPKGTPDEQDDIAKRIMRAYFERERLIKLAFEKYNQAEENILGILKSETENNDFVEYQPPNSITISEIKSRVEELNHVEEEIEIEIEEENEAEQSA